MSSMSKTALFILLSVGLVVASVLGLASLGVLGGGTGNRLEPALDQGLQPAAQDGDATPTSGLDASLPIMTATSSPTAKPTALPSATTAPEATAAPTTQVAPTSSAKSTKRTTRTPTSTQTPTQTPTRTAAVAATNTPTRTRTATIAVSPTTTRTPSATPALVLTPTRTGLPSGSPTATPTRRASGSIVVDHNSVALFDQIPDAYIEAASRMRMLYIDASVGENINGGLDCLAYPSDEVSRPGCRRGSHPSPEFNAAPEDLDWARPGGYDRANWHYQPWSGAGCGMWSEKPQCFITMVDPLIQQYDVLSYQFSYMDIIEGSTIADPTEGFFVDSPRFRDVYDLEGYAAQHPDKTFIYWTTSLARAIGTREGEAFNEQMQEYAIAHGKPLFDVADILSHDPYGNPCYDNRDGVPYSHGSKSENYPDDGANIPAICQHYTTEVEGGHLGGVKTGSIRVAKAFWVLMARLAGWSG